MRWRAALGDGVVVVLGVDEVDERRRRAGPGELGGERDGGGLALGLVAAAAGAREEPHFR